MSIQQNQSEDLDLIVRCLVRFIRDHAGDARLSALSLDEMSIKGKRVKEQKDLWFLGKWAIHGISPRYKATWSTDTSSGETILVTVDIEKTDHEYEVTDWDMKHILF